MIVQKQLIINSNQKMIELTEAKIPTKKKKKNSPLAIFNKVCTEYLRNQTEEDEPISKFELPFYQMEQTDKSDSDSPDGRI